MGRLMNQAPGGLTALAAVLLAGPALAQTAADYTTYYQYDPMRRPVMEIGPDPDGSGALKRRATKTTYDADGRVVRVDVGTVDAVSASAGVVTVTNFVALQSILTRYDVVGNKTQVHAFPGTAAASLTQTNYDAVNRPLCTAVRMNEGLFAGLYSGTDRPNACALTTESAQGADRVTRTVYDAAGQALQTLQAVGTTSQRTYAAYGYTPNGKQQTITDANGNTTTLSYDGFDRLKRQYYPSTTRGSGASSTTDFEEYHYDPNGNRYGWRRRDGSGLGYGYDALNRMVYKGGDIAPIVNYAHDLAGRPVATTFASSGQGVSYTYDTAGRQKTETTFGRTLNYEYDKAGNRTLLYWPDGAVVVSAYDAAGKVYWLGDGINFGVNTTRDDLGRLAVIGSTNRASIIGYDPAGRLASLQHALPSNTAAAATFGFSYNAASQMVGQTISNNAYVWSGANINLSATADGLNRDAAIAAIGGGGCGASKGYDCRGNLTNDGANRTFGYDGENRLTSVGGSVAAGLEYDPLGRLSKTTINGAVTQFLYSGDRLVAEYDGAGALLRRYAHGQGTDVPLVWIEGSGISSSATRYLLTDRQGSVIGAVDNAGVSIAKYTYGPYGQPGDNWGAGSRFRYTGQIALPELKLYHYKARVYDPARGWFLQTDPIGYKDDLNLYAYVGGDPLNKTDPTGTKSLVGWVVRRVTGGLKEMRRVNDKAEGVRLLKSGQDVKFTSKQSAKEAARAAGDGGKPITERHRLKDGSNKMGAPHAHDAGRSGGHAFWGAVAGASSTLTGAMDDVANEIGTWEDKLPAEVGGAERARAQAIDFIDPASNIADNLRAVSDLVKVLTPKQ